MIKLIKQGKYRIVKTRDHKIMLYLDRQGYLWGFAKKIGDLLTFSKHGHKTSHWLAEGNYKIYDVKNDPRLVDLKHLELSVSDKWQGYLLLTDLPTRSKIRSRIIPTDEIISLAQGKAGI